jgi:enoyl-CoA hydratase/carnithine racemase
MAELVISAPGRNALATEVMRDLLARLRAAAGDPLLVTGAGDAFSAGLNLREVASADRAGMERLLDTLEELVEALWGYPGPTVACVTGHAIAGGCVVMLCCDHRVAADDTAIRIGLNEVALGLHYPPKVLAMVRRRVPLRALERVVLGAELHAPRAAVALGLVDEVAADAAVLARARLAALAAHPAEAYSATKRALRGDALRLTADEVRRFREETLPAWCTPATRERARALLGGRRGGG